MRALSATYILGMYELAIFESHLVGKDLSDIDVFGRVMEPPASTPIHARYSSLCVGSYARNCGTVRFRCSSSSSHIVDLAISAIRFASTKLIVRPKVLII